MEEDTPITKNITTTLSESFRLGTRAEESEYAKKYFSLNGWQYLIIIGIAVSGLAAFVTTYNAISGINATILGCTKYGNIKRELTIKFIIILTLSCFAVVLGLILAWFFRKKQNQRRILTLGIITTGILGIIYSLSIKLQDFSDSIKLIASWLAFIIFLFLGYFLSTKKSVTLTTPSLTWEV